MGRRDMRRGSFACPGCKQRLRRPDPSGYELVAGVVGSGLLAFLVPYWLGARDSNLFWDAILLFLPMCLGIGSGLGAFRGFLFPRLERDTGEDKGGILHITGPPDSSNKS